MEVETQPSLHTHTDTRTHCVASVSSFYKLSESRGTLGFIGL